MPDEWRVCLWGLLDVSNVAHTRTLQHVTCFSRSHCVTKPTMTTNSPSGPNPIINSMEDVNMTHSWSLYVLLHHFHELLIRLAARRVYANYFEDCWLEHCHCHSLPTWRLKLLHGLTLKIKNVKLVSSSIQAQQCRRPKPSEVHPRLLCPGLWGKRLSPWPWKHAKVGKRSSYQGDMTSNEQLAPHQYMSPVIQPSVFLDVDSIQSAKNHLPMSS